jgi:two-component system OmpR family sensor kinase
MSITRRLIVQLTLMVAAFWLTTAIVTRYVVVKEIDEIVSENISKTAIRLMPLALHSILPDKEESDHDGDHNEPLELEEDLRFLRSGHAGFLAFELRDSSGNVLLRSYDAKGFDFPPIGRDGFLSQSDLVSFTITDRQSGFVLTLIEPASHRSEAIREATIALLLPLLILIPLMILAVIYITRRSIAPIQDLRRKIASRGGSNLEPIEIDGQPEELKPIANSVDRLLARLKTALNAEKAFAANSAHELRTPIAGALAQTQQLIHEMPEGKGRKRLEEVESTLKRLSDFTVKLLQLSRVDAGVGASHARSNLSPVLLMVIEEFSRNSRQSKKIVFEDRLKQELMVAMDADAFAICVRNLLENALNHSTSNKPVRIVLEDNWKIHVINSGKVVPAELLAVLTQRYTRGETAADGSGLGLSIVERIMDQCGGNLSFHSPASGMDNGFEAVLQLP